MSLLGRFFRPDDYTGNRYSIYSQESSEELRTYLEEVGRIARTSPEEDQALGRCLIQARKIAHASMIRPFLKKRAEKASHRLIEGNLRLVVALARWAIAHSPDIHPLSLLDLIQEGNLGLFDAVERYDPVKGPFGTYAAHWIRRHISLAIKSQTRSIPLPLRTMTDLHRMAKTRSAFMIPPSHEALAEAMGLSVAKVTELLIYEQEILSLETPIAETAHGEPVLLADVLPDAILTDPQDILEMKELQKLLQEALDQLSEKERLVVLDRYSDHPSTHQELADQFGVSKMSVGNWERTALKKLRQFFQNEWARLSRI